MKELEDMSFRELVDEATRETHNGLLASGGAGLRSAVFAYMETAIRWNLAQEYKKNAKTHKS
jgi:hypothetical protein